MTQSNGPDVTWHKLARCRPGRIPDPDVFFPDHGSNTLAAQATALALCDACPVVLTCREWAITERQQWGVWGGLIQIELRKAIRERYGTARRRRGPIAVMLASCPNGHDYTTENTRYDKRGFRYCVLCHRASARRHHAKRRLRQPITTAAQAVTEASRP